MLSFIHFLRHTVGVLLGFGFVACIEDVVVQSEYYNSSSQPPPSCKGGPAAPKRRQGCHSARNDFAVIFQVPSFASRNMIPNAINLVNAADPDSELARVTWQMPPLGILIHQVTGVSSRLYPVGASMATLDRRNCAMRYIAQYGRVIPIHRHLKVRPLVS